VAEPVVIGGRSFGGAAFPDEPPAPKRPARARRALRGSVRAVLGWAARPARLIPGLGAVGCGVAGAYVLWGLGVALLVAAGFCLLLDARTPRG
jgi:hypothetical protein